MSKLANMLLRVSRYLRDFGAVSSGSSKKMARRGKNKLAGRMLGKFTRGLWR